MKSVRDDVYAVILAGGDGERLWPVSTPARPKQFVETFGGRALIAQAVDRLEGLVPPERILVITAERLVPLTRKALPAIPRRNIVGEPCRCNTAAAVAVACGIVRRRGGAEAVGCILTADQLITPASAFRRVLADSVKAARKLDAIVTLGITPDYPATGFGYIESGETAATGTRTRFHAVRRFVEKPDLATARRYLKSGRFRWNAGMFIWRASVMESAFARHAPDIGELIGKVAASRNLAKTLAAEYPSVRRTSVDYAVMEKTRDILVAECGFRWDDVGSWTAIANHFQADANGNTVLGAAKLVDASGTIVVSGEDHLTAVLGLRDVVVVHTPAATLVCAKDRVQDVRKLLK